MILAVCMMAAVLSGCAGKNADKDMSNDAQSTTQTSSNEEPETEPFSWAIADGSYDAESMNKMR